MNEESKECSTGVLIEDFNLDEELSKISLNAEKPECSTGILIDFEDVVLDEEPENSSLHCLNLNKRRDNKLLGAELNNLGNVPSTPRGGWKTPSPKSMRKISKEATRIVDEMLDEEQVINEGFPSPFSQVGSLSESSPELEDESKSANSNKDNDSIPKVTSPAVIHYSHESIPEVARPVIKMYSSNSPNQNKEELGDIDLTEPFFRAMTTFNDNLPDKEEWSIQYKNKSPGCKENNAVDDEIDDIEYLIHPFRPPRLNLKLFESEMKTPLVNTNPPGNKNVTGRRNVIECPNRNIPVKKNREPAFKDPNLNLTRENPSRNIKTNISDEIDSSRKIPYRNPGLVKNRTSGLPQLASTMPSLPGPLQKTALNRTSKIASPIPKFVRRSQSFQHDSGRCVPEKAETVAAPRQSQSRIGGIRKVPNPVVLRPRSSIGQIPISSNSSFASVSRSKSFPKSSVATCSRISRPTFLSTRKVHPAGQRTPPPDRSLINEKMRTSLSEIRYFCHTDLPSPWPGFMNDRLCRQLFSDEDSCDSKSSDKS